MTNPACKTKADLLNWSSSGLSGDLAEHYRAHATHTRESQRLTPEEWLDRILGDPSGVTSKAMRHARKIARKALGLSTESANFATVPHRILDVPRPQALPIESGDALAEAILSDDAMRRRVFKRLGFLDDPEDLAHQMLKNSAEVERRVLWQLQANLAEELHRPTMLRWLAETNESLGAGIEARYLLDVRAKSRNGDTIMEFGDGMIVTLQRRPQPTPNGLRHEDMQLKGLVEIKYGTSESTTGGAAQAQVFDWNEMRIDDMSAGGELGAGLEILVPVDSHYIELGGQPITRYIKEIAPGIEILDPDRSREIVRLWRRPVNLSPRDPRVHRSSSGAVYWKFNYDPQSTLVSQPPKVIGLQRAPRRIVTARGRSRIGLDPSMDINTLRAAQDADDAVTVLEHPLEQDAMDWLMAQLLAQKAKG